MVVDGRNLLAFRISADGTVSNENDVPWSSDTVIRSRNHRNVVLERWFPVEELASFEPPISVPKSVSGRGSVAVVQYDWNRKTQKWRTRVARLQPSELSN